MKLNTIHFKKIAVSVPLLALVLLADPVYAIDWTETGDAGQLVSTAQMPSRDYYKRQAAILHGLTRLANSERAAERYLQRARHYESLAKQRSTDEASTGTVQHQQQQDSKEAHKHEYGSRAASSPRFHQ